MAIITTALFGDLVFLPYRVEAPMKETLSWKTSIFTSHDGSETTEKTRTIPRTKLQYSLPIPADEMARSFNLFSNSVGRRWAIPLWSEEQHIGAVSGGDSFITATVASYAFRNSSLAVLWESKANWQLVEITTIVGTTINISGTTNAFTNALLMPCRVGYIEGTPQRPSNLYNGKITVDFQVEDGAVVAELVPAQYDSADMYDDELFYSGTMKEKFQNKVNIVDNKIGVVSYSTPWVDSRNAKTAGWVLETPLEIYEFRQFLARRVGKYRSFWQPSFFNDLRNASSGAIGTVLRVYLDDYLDHVSDRVHISIQDNSDTWYHREILVAIGIGSDLLDLSLDSALGIDASDIKTISYLGLKRFESDNVSINWLGGGVAKSTIGILEVSH